MNGLTQIQEKLKKALDSLKHQDLENLNIKPGNIESLAKAQQLGNDDEEGELTDALKGIHSVLDELNNHALNLLKNVDHKMVVRRHEPKPIKITNNRGNSEGNSEA